jgi:hypothetical protein
MAKQGYGWQVGRWVAKEGDGWLSREMGGQGGRWVAMLGRWLVKPGG